MSKVTELNSALSKMFSGMSQTKELEVLENEIVRCTADYAIKHGLHETLSLCVSTGQLSESDYDEMIDLACRSGQMEILKIVTANHPALNVETLYNTLEQKGLDFSCIGKAASHALINVKMDILFDPIVELHSEIKVDVDQFFSEIAEEEECLTEICKIMEIVFKGGGWEMTEPFTFIMITSKNQSHSS